MVTAQREVVRAADRAARSVVAAPARPAHAKARGIVTQLGRVADDGVTDTAPVAERYPDCAALLEADESVDEFRVLRRAKSVGRPRGDDGFLGRLEALTGRRFRAEKPGPKPKTNALSP